MRYLVCLILCLLFVTKNNAGMVGYEQIISNKEKVKEAVKEELQQEIVLTDDPLNMETEIAVAINDLQKIPESERSFFKYFTLYSMAKSAELLQAGYEELIFWIHSLSSEGFFAMPQPVEGSSTLFRIDIRDYGWTEEAWEKISVADPYFREPWIDHKLANTLRYESGNAIVRADWFIDSTSSPNKQILRNEAEILYYTLLYAKRGGKPPTLADFYDFWGIDREKIETKVQTVEQILVSAGDSGVANENRTLARSNIELGAYYETSDFFSSSGKQNVMDNIVPDKLQHPNRDAAEGIVTNKLGLQAYIIADKQGKIIDVADPNIAWDRNDHHSVVIEARDCVICHAKGINAASNAYRANVEHNIRLAAANKEKYLAMKRTFSRDMESKMARDADNYNEAVQKCNGLTSQENAVKFKEVLDFYNQPLDRKQAALECGVTEEEFAIKVGENSSSGRLRPLGKGVGTITRNEWDNPKGGYFAQAMLLIKGLPMPPEKEEPQSQEEVVAPPVVPSVLYIVTNKDANLKAGTRVLGYVPSGTRLKVLEKQDIWYKVQTESILGWLHQNDVIEEK